MTKSLLALCLTLALLGIATSGQTQAPKSTAQGKPNGWRRFTPPDQSFSVDLPGPPEHEHDPVLRNDLLTGESYTSMGATANGLQFYVIAVLCVDKFKAGHLSLDALLKGLADESEHSGNTNSGKPITVDGMPGREVVSIKGDEFSSTRWIIAGPRIYMLSVVSGGDAHPSLLAQRFFDSFHVTGAPSSRLADCPSTEGRLPVATAGKIHIVSFPDSWMSNRPGRKNTLLSAEWYEVRAAPNSDTHELFFGALSFRDERAQKQNEEWYGRNFYGVSLGSPVHIRSVNKTEWNQTRAVSHQTEQIFSGSLDNTKPAAFKYHDREYAKSSEHWGCVIVSPNGRWIALYSYSGQNTEATFLGGGVPREGDVYWDVYDIRTGEKVLAWTARFVPNPALLGAGAVWVTDEFLVMPFDTTLQSCVIGVLPKNGNGNSGISSKLLSNDSASRLSSALTLDHQ